MTLREEFEWVTSLGDCREARLRAIQHLLRHAHGDQMSAEDRAVCARWLARLSEHWVIKHPAFGLLECFAPESWTKNPHRARWFEEFEAEMLVLRMRRIGGLTSATKERM